MATFSLFTDFTTPSGKVNIIELGKDIINGKYELQINEYRAEKIFGDKDKAEQLKKKLPAFTPSGIFNARRKAENLEMYSSYIHLDYDKLSPSDLLSIKEIVSACPFTVLAFVSPSGDGLKVFIEVNSGSEQHALAYQQVKDHYDNLTGFVADEKCKDITRLCFVSFDSQAHRSITATKFKIDLPDEDLPIAVINPSPIPSGPTIVEQIQDLSLDFKFNQAVSFTENKTSFHEGNRNNFIYQLASNCNRSGISQQDCEDLCIARYDLKHSEIRASVKSAYSNHFAEHGKFANSKPKTPLSQPSPFINSNDVEDFLKSTPTIPDHIFETLPDVLRAGCSAFDDPRRKDVFLISALAILSGCLPGVSGVYHGERVFPHLYIFVIAPPASGKGVLKNAKKLGDKYHERVLKASRDAQSDFNQQNEDYKNACRTAKKTDSQPEKPEDLPYSFHSCG